MTDKEQVWAQMAQEHPKFLPEYDIVGNHHAIREIVLGGSVTWAGVWQRFKPHAGMKVMDIGANAGVFAIYCALQGAIVDAYEPDAEYSEKLRDLAKKAYLPIKVLPFAIWKEQADQLFISHRSPIEDGALRFNGSLRSDGINWTPDDADKAQRVPCITLDEAIGKFTWDAVKLDIEGAESEVLLAASLETLRRIKFAYVEFHPWVSESLYKQTVERMEAVYKFDGAYWNTEIGRWEAAYLSL